METPRGSIPVAVDPVEPQSSTHEPMEMDTLPDGSAPYDLEMIGPDENGKQMVSAFIMIGANVEQARTHTAAVRGRTDAPTFMEFFGRGEIVREANRARRELNIRGLHALDLRTYRPDGTA